MEKTVRRPGLDLTEGNITQQLIAFVLPLLFANIVQQMYNTVDMMIIGQFVGSVGTSGVSNGGEVATLITFMASSFGSAAQIYVAQLSGAKNRKAITETLITGLVFVSILAFLCCAFCIVFSAPLLNWLRCPAEALSHASSYMIIVSLGLPFVFGYNMVCGVLRGMGEAKRPLLFVSIAAVSNVFMDLLLVVVFKMEAAGTAIATVVAQIASFVASAIYLYNKREQFDLQFTKENVRIHKNHFIVLVKLGIPLTAHSAFIHLTQLICTRHINSFGIIASTTNSIGNKIQKLVNIFSNSVSQGSGAMIGQNIGAKKYDRVKAIVGTTILLASIFSILACCLVLFIPRQTFGLFITADDPNYAAVMDLGVTYLQISTIVFILSPVQGSMQAVINGSGNARLSLIAGLLDGVVLRLGISFVLAYAKDMGIIGFFLGNNLSRLAPTIVGLAYYLSGRWKTFKLISNQK